MGTIEMKGAAARPRHSAMAAVTCMRYFERILDNLFFFFFFVCGCDRSG